MKLDIKWAGYSPALLLCPKPNKPQGEKTIYE